MKVEEKIAYEKNRLIEKYTEMMAPLQFADGDFGTVIKNMFTDLIKCIVMMSKKTETIKRNKCSHR